MILAASSLRGGSTVFSGSSLAVEPPLLNDINAMTNVELQRNRESSPPRRRAADNAREVNRKRRASRDAGFQSMMIAGSVATIRLTTVKDQAGRIDVRAAYLRLGRSKYRMGSYEFALAVQADDRVDCRGRIDVQSGLKILGWRSELPSWWSKPIKELKL